MGSALAVVQPERPLLAATDLDIDFNGALDLRFPLRTADRADTLGETVIAPPPATFGAPAEPPVPAPSSLSQEFAGVQPRGGTWAVIIGVNDYPGGRNDLRSAVNDALDVDEALARYGVSMDRRLLLTDRQVSTDVLRRSTAWLAAHASPDATAVFFFAGHVRKIATGREAMVAADGGMVDDIELAELLGAVKARRMWIGVAACYGGGFTEVLHAGRILTAAADSDSLAYESSDFGRSYMVEYMVRRAMIQGAAPQSVEASYLWAAEALRRDFPHRMPYQVDYAHGDLALGAGGASASAPSGSGGGSSSTGSAGSSGGSNGGQRSTPPPRRDTCSSVSLGVVRCKA